MIIHQTIVVQMLVEAASVAFQQLKEVSKVIVGPKQDFAVMASVHEMVITTRLVLSHPWNARHGGHPGIRFSARDAVHFIRKGIFGENSLAASWGGRVLATTGKEARRWGSHTQQGAEERPGHGFCSNS